MATIKISRAKSCSAAIDYAKGHDKLRESDKSWLIQNGVPIDTVDALDSRSVATSGVLVDPDYAKSQMKQTRELFQNTGNTEAMRVIQSFSHEDLDPLNPADWQRCNDLGNELAQRIAPNHQVAIYTHIDGTGHMLHNHIIINMPNLETGRKYNHNNDWQRVVKLNDEMLRERGLSVIDREQSPAERRTMAERQIDAKNEYVWKDDLRSRIDKAILDSPTSSYKDFSEHLAQSGIIIHDRGKNFSYEFLDADKKYRCARGKTLGGDYERETILNELERQNRQPATELPRLVEPSRQIKQREQHFESRKPTIIQSGQSIDRLTRTAGQTQQTARAVANNLNRQSRRKRRFRDRITSFGKALIRLESQANAYFKRLRKKNAIKSLQAKLAQSKQHKQSRDDRQRALRRTYELQKLNQKPERGPMR